VGQTSHSNVSQVFVIGGYVPSHLGIDSVVIGFYRDKQLRYAARVRAGFMPLTRRQVFERIQPLILSMRGSVSQGVYRAAIGQRALLFDELLGREMGISTWVVFTGTDNNALAHGEFVTRPDELQKLLKALISRNIKVVSIRNHMVGEHPEFLFVRFWQQGRSVEVAKGVRYALDVQVGAIATEHIASQ
jgi:Domain of Unknown Function (DUF1259)